MRTCGVDIGRNNLALSFFDLETNTVLRVYLIDMTIEADKKLELRNMDYGPVVHRWMKKYAHEFEKCNIIGIENQLAIATELMKIIQAHVYSTLAIMYPNAKTILADPRSVRKWFGTDGGGEYSERKRLGEACQAFHAVDIKAMKSLFRKDVYSVKTKKFTKKTKIDDVVDASCVAMYVAYHPNDESSKPIGKPTDTIAVIMMKDVHLVAPDRKRKSVVDLTTDEPKKRKRVITT